jgi:hypothetical protein
MAALPPLFSLAVCPPDGSKLNVSLMGASWFASPQGLT